MRVKELIRMLTDASPDKGKELRLYFFPADANGLGTPAEIAAVDSNETTVKLILTRASEVVDLKDIADELPHVSVEPESQPFE